MTKTVTNDVKSDFWTVEVTQRRYLDVVFTDPVTIQEAYNHVTNESYEDIIDVEDMEVISFIGAIPHNVEGND